MSNGIYKYARRRASMWDYLGESLWNEVKHTGGGIKPIGNAAAGLVSLGMWRPFEYGYNPNDLYLSEGMQKFRSGALGAGELALSLAMPAGALSAVGKAGKGLNWVNRAGKWIYSPIKSTKRPILGTAGNLIAKGIPRAVLMESEWLSGLRHVPAISKGTIKAVPGKTWSFVKKHPFKTGIGYFMFKDWPTENYHKNELDRKFQQGELSPEEWKLLGVDPIRHNRYVSENNRPWYEYYDLDGDTARDRLRQNGIEV